MSKLIREGRFGPPKSWKSGSIYSSYPRPLLALALKREELDIVREPVFWIDQDKLEDACKQSTKDMHPLAAIDLGMTGKDYQLEPLYQMPKDPTSWPNVVKAVNTITTKGCPWKTVVFDNTSDLSDAIQQHQAAINFGGNADPRKWAPAIGAKIQHLVVILGKLPCHTVIIMHQFTDKNEITSEISTLPLIYSSVRETIGSLLSQFFYQTMVNGQPTVLTKATGFVKGIGARWPSDLPVSISPPTFQNIYGAAIKSGEIEL
jgi:hypothetical protein